MRKAEVQQTDNIDRMKSVIHLFRLPAAHFQGLLISCRQLGSFFQPLVHLCTDRIRRVNQHPLLERSLAGELHLYDELLTLFRGTEQVKGRVLVREYQPVILLVEVGKLPDLLPRNQHLDEFDHQLLISGRPYDYLKCLVVEQVGESFHNLV